MVWYIWNTMRIQKTFITTPLLSPIGPTESLPHIGKTFFADADDATGRLCKSHNMCQERYPTTPFSPTPFPGLSLYDALRPSTSYLIYEIGKLDYKILHINLYTHFCVSGRISTYNRYFRKTSR